MCTTTLVVSKVVAARPEHLPVQPGAPGAELQIFGADFRGELRAEVAKAIFMGLSGVPWWTTDAGAFFTGGTASWRRYCGDPEAEPVWFWRGDYDDGVANPGYRELCTRWLQFGCFLPMFRSHGTDTPREVWNFGSPGEPFYDAIVETIRLRYRLLPYIYTVAAEASRDGGLMVRGLLFDFSDDPIARAVSDQFLLELDQGVATILIVVGEPVVVVEPTGTVRSPSTGPRPSSSSTCCPDPLRIR